MIQTSDSIGCKRTAIVLSIYDLRRNICLKVLTFSVIGEKPTFGFRNHAKIWVSGLGPDGAGGSNDHLHKNVLNIYNQLYII